MAKLRIHTAGSARLYEILDDEVRVGRDADNHIRVKSDAVAPFHLRLRRTSSGYRAEVARADLRVDVNGATVAERDLVGGDRIALGGVELEFVGDEASGRSAARPTGGGASRRTLDTRPAAPRPAASPPLAGRPQATAADADARSSGARSSGSPSRRAPTQSASPASSASSTSAASPASSAAPSPARAEPAAGAVPAALAAASMPPAAPAPAAPAPAPAAPAPAPAAPAALDPRAIVIPATPSRGGGGAGRGTGARGNRDDGDRRAGGRRARRGGGGRGATSWAWGSTLLVLAAGAIFVAVRVLQSESGKSARELLALAQAQVQAGHSERALATLNSAAASQPDARTRQDIDDLKAHLELVMQKQTDVPLLAAARQGVDVLLQLERLYLTEAPTYRPASRELVRRADAWLERFAAVCNRHEDGRRDVQRVEGLRARYLPHARLEEPDSAADVLFAAERPLKLVPKRYKEAVALLDEWLGRSGGGAEADLVRQQRAAIVARAQEYVERELRFLDGELAKGKREAVKSGLVELREVALPESVPLIEAKLRDLP